MQQVANWLTLEVLLQLHGDQPFNSLKQVVVEWRNPWGGTNTLATLSPVAFPGCYLPRSSNGSCNTTGAPHLGVSKFIPQPAPHRR